MMKWIQLFWSNKKVKTNKKTMIGAKVQNMWKQKKIVKVTKKKKHLVLDINQALDNNKIKKKANLLKTKKNKNKNLKKSPSIKRMISLIL